jgi:type IV pilus assembly protein PilV
MVNKPRLKPSGLRNPGHSRERGVGLIEVLISILVIAIGLLGLAALQGKAQKAELESYQRSQALILLQDMSNRLRANRGDKGGYMDGGECITSTCTSDKEVWQGLLQNTLISGTGCITESRGEFMISVAWQGLATVGTTATSNTCGSAIPNRRVMSVPIRFFDTGS